jgi:hypothetical protein
MCHVQSLEKDFYLSTFNSLNRVFTLVCEGKIIKFSPNCCAYSITF